MEQMIRSKINSTTSYQEEGVIEVIVNSGKLDRQGEILDINGLDLTNYLESPVVAWGHKYDEPAIGKATKVWKDSSTGALKAVVKFAIEHSDMAKLVYNLIKDGYMNAFSIGFIPIEGEEDKDGNLIYTKSEMLEFSAVLVGADPRALATAKSLYGDEAEKVLKGEINAKDFHFKPYSESDEAIEKSGRVLNKSNRKLLKDAVMALQAVIDADSKEESEEKEVDIDPAVEIAEKALDGIKQLKSQEGRTDYKKVKRIATILYRASDSIIREAKTKELTIKIRKNNGKRN